MKAWHRTVLIVLVLVSCIGCDQASKDLVQDTLRHAPPTAVLGGALHLVYTENAGVALGMGAGLGEPARFWMFTVTIGLLLTGILVFALVNIRLQATNVLGIALVLGGGASNLIDRLANDGRVIDFLMIRLNDVYSAIFNLADVAILVGFALLLVGIWRMSRAGDDVGLIEAACEPGRSVPR